ncbi:TetR/AcrR family transcriptional regulator [Nocardia sp. NPDC004722]
MTTPRIENGGPRLRSVGRRVTPERLARIADVALDVAVESGFAAVTMQTVAKRADYVRPVVYDCYGTPENILLTVLEREKSLLTDQLDQAVAMAEGDPTRWLLSYAEVIVANPRSWRLFTQPTEGADESVRASVAEFREHLRRGLESWVSELTANRATPADSEALSVLVLGAIDAVGIRMAGEPGDFDTARIESFVRSLASRLRSIPRDRQGLS